MMHGPINIRFTSGEVYNKNILLMNKISSDIKTVLIVIQNF